MVKGKSTSNHYISDVEASPMLLAIRYYLGNAILSVFHFFFHYSALSLFMFISLLKLIDNKIDRKLRSRRKLWRDQKRRDEASSSVAAKEAETEADESAQEVAPPTEIKGKEPSDQIEDSIEDEELSTPSPHQDSVVEDNEIKPESPVEKDESTSLNRKARRAQAAKQRREPGKSKNPANG